ncbi:MAG: chitooligosaccharide deacetylase [Bacteroidetes bacterium HGW-Bacteroidetes-4]|jgi:sialate O-acetylesterase|nr:MAG: chitooligosaccharide deacetylase [Bacteroidetes bacterium HGW-Bacteroidetes-4]
MVLKTLIFQLMLILPVIKNIAQNTNSDEWNGHQCAVVLTYDDGLNVHLDKVIPLLDSVDFKATFYVPGNASALDNRLVEWAIASKTGHELGNHTLNHPCAGKSMGRPWVNPDYDLDDYSANKIIDEIKLANTLLKAIDGKSQRTFAYTCGDTQIGGDSFIPEIKNSFVAARSVGPSFEPLSTIDLYQIGAFMVNGESGSELISMVQQALDNKVLLVFLFHGVGGEHTINVSLEAHRQLIQFLKDKQSEIWVAPLVEIAHYVNNNQK